MDDAERRWSRVRGALHSEVARVAELFCSIQEEPGGVPRRGPALGSWDAGDIAMHLSQTWMALPGLARGDVADVEEQVPGRPVSGALVGGFDELGAFTEAGVRADPERDLGVLADRIVTRAEGHIAGCVPGTAHERRPWLLEGVTVPLPVLSAHLLNETVVHGSDVARAVGRPWRIDPVHAGLVVDEFLMAVLGEAGPGLPGRRPPGAGVRGVCEIRVRGGRRHRLRVQDGGVTIDDDGGRPDCHASVDPVDMLLVFFGRYGPATAVARGGMTAWGRRPWLALAAIGAMPTP